jgi:protein-disulfide isomerase
MVRKFALSASLCALTFAAACAQENAAPADRAATEQIVREYILANPEIIEDALIALNEKRELEQEAEARVAVAANADKIFKTAGDYSIGPDDAAVTVVEFFDYRCGPCRSSMETVNALPERYGGQVRVVFKEFPILSPESRIAAVAALAAGRQGKYIEMHREFMKSPSQFAEADIVKIAREIDLDMNRWMKDRQDKVLRDQIDDTYELAQTIGANATPTFVIGDTLFSGLNAPKLETLIAEGIAKAG